VVYESLQRLDLSLAFAYRAIGVSDAEKANVRTKHGSVLKEKLDVVLPHTTLLHARFSVSTYRNPAHP
tara:strand:+ start:569 stop:772 length:204 start_codon:yes stop_codon:yes gene_type:complete